jgi:hypothetical protein
MPTLTDVVEIQVAGLVGLTGGGSKRVMNVFHYTKTTGGVRPVAANVCAAFITNVWSVIGPLLSVDYVGEFSQARYLDDALEQFVTSTVPDDGAVTGDRLPNDMSVCYLLRSASRGRNYRGSKHFGPIAESASTKDELNAGAVTAWAAVTAALMATLTVGGETMTPCVISKTLSQLQLNPTTIDGALLVDALLNKTIGTMRRRREKTIR